MAPGSCAPDNPYLKPREWAMTFSYRHYHAFRDYKGGKRLPVPSPPELYASTYVNDFDLDLTYAFTPRFSLSLELPLSKGSRTTYYEHDGVNLHTMRASGIGDMKVIGNFWLFEPESHVGQNIAVKFGIKTPTGNHSARDISFRPEPVSRPVDPAIQPASGGVGIIFGFEGFKRLAKRTVVYTQGVYLSSPREMNGTETPFGDLPDFTLGDISYTIDSVPDQFFGQVGVSQTVWPKKGVAVTCALRTDGVPPRDLIGGSEGWRLPGYSISVEPGISVTKGKHYFTLTVPITVKGHGSANVADSRNHSPLAGIDTIADSQLTISYSRRF